MSRSGLEIASLLLAKLDQLSASATVEQSELVGNGTITFPIHLWNGFAMTVFTVAAEERDAL